MQSVGPTNDGVSFATVGENESMSGDTNTGQGRRLAPRKGSNPLDIATKTCYKCGMKGHSVPVGSTGGWIVFETRFGFRRRYGVVLFIQYSAHNHHMIIVPTIFFVRIFAPSCTSSLLPDVARKRNVVYIILLHDREK
jgi:hypothetical protein